MSKKSETGWQITQQERRARGECPRCGAKIDVSEGYVYCIDCRAKRSTRARLLRTQQKREAEMFAQRAQAEICRTCYWARRDGDRIFCPSAQGTCIRREMLMGPEPEPVPERDE